MEPVWWYFYMFEAMRQLNESNDVEKGQMAIKHLRIAKVNLEFSVQICVSTGFYYAVDIMIILYVGICCNCILNFF